MNFPILKMSHRRYIISTYDMNEFLIMISDNLNTKRLESDEIRIMSSGRDEPVTVHVISKVLLNHSIVA